MLCLISDKDPLFIHLISAVIVSEVILPEALSSSLSNHYPISPIINQTHGFTTSVARSSHDVIVIFGILNIPGQAKRVAKTFVHIFQIVLRCGAGRYHSSDLVDSLLR